MYTHNTYVKLCGVSICKTKDTWLNWIEEEDEPMSMNSWVVFYVLLNLYYISTQCFTERSIQQVEMKMMKQQKILLLLSTIIM